jgi:hypothetical protein
MRPGRSECGIFLAAPLVELAGCSAIMNVSRRGWTRRSISFPPNEVKAMSVLLAQFYYTWQWYTLCVVAVIGLSVLLVYMMRKNEDDDD